MIESFLTYIKDQKLISKGDTILLAVSGGVDSMVLIDLMSKGKIAFGVGHINHNLRGPEADADAELVRSYCLDNGIRYHHVKLPEDFFESGNTQSNARKFRYQWLRNIASDHGYNCIATAHHLDDSIETFFINLLRGTGIDGLKGIKPRSEDIIRPLLFATKNEIIQYAEDHKVPFREDGSNASDKYTRNKIRHHLIPLLSEIDPRFPAHILQTICNIDRSSELYTYLLGAGLETNSSNETTINLSKYPSDDNLKIEWLYQILKKYGFNETQAEDIVTKPNGSRTFLSNEYVIYQRGHVLTISKKLHEKVDECFNLNWNGLTELANGQKILCTVIDNSQDFVFMKDQIYLDVDKLDKETTIRFWREGDKIAPLGMGGKFKSLQDVFTDKKLNPKEKQETPVVISNDNIAAVLPYITSELYKVDKNTKLVLILKLAQPS